VIDGSHIAGGKLFQIIGPATAKCRRMWISRAVENVENRLSRMTPRLGALSDDAHLASVCWCMSVSYIGPNSRTERLN